jgi:signal transduction histidine kinase
MSCADKISPEFIEDTISCTVGSDLKNLLSAIRGRTILLKHMTEPSNPLQLHFDEILHCIDESSDITDLLLDPNLQ